MSRIIIDVDGVLADLHSRWLQLYYENTGEKIEPPLTTDIYSTVKYPQLLREILEFLSYDKVKPISLAIPSVKKLMGLGFEVIFASCCINSHAVKEKERWLVKRFGKGITFIPTEFKGFLKGDYLISDRMEDFEGFEGCKIFFRNMWNSWYAVPEQVLVASGWRDVLRFLEPRAGLKPSAVNPKDIASVNEGRLPLHLVPPASIAYEAVALKRGALKYGPYNWRIKGQEPLMLVYLDSAIRHLLAFLDGEDIDQESGCHHLGAAKANLGILIDSIELGTVVDNRPPKGAVSRLLWPLRKD